MIWLILLLIFLSTILGAAGALLFKKASKNLSIMPLRLIRNYTLICGVMLYGFASILFVYALKLEDLSVLYPMTALSYVWATIGAKKFFNEKITKNKIIGIALIILGVVVIAIK